MGPWGGGKGFLQPPTSASPLVAEGNNPTLGKYIHISVYLYTDM